MVRGVEKISCLLSNSFEFVYYLRDPEGGGEDGRYCRGRDGTSIHRDGDVEKVDPAVATQSLVEFRKSCLRSSCVLMLFSHVGGFHWAGEVKRGKLSKPRPPRAL